MRTPALLLLAGMAAGCITVEDAAQNVADATVETARTAQYVTVEGAKRVHRAATGPHFSPMPQEIAAAPADMQASAPNSLWRSGARAFFNDQRATTIGDILTVRVEIDDSAELENATNRRRQSNTDVGVTSLFGKEEALGRVLPPGGNFDPANLIGAQSSSTAVGNGAINRSERIELTLAGTITDVLPNGNLIVAGRQEVRINGELRELWVTGVIRPQDIAPDNSVRHDQMAEARISYGGRGTISAVQRPRLGQRIADAVSPW
jgi:flagellar L-ring protein precursor FlgH